MTLKELWAELNRRAQKNGMAAKMLTNGAHVTVIIDAGVRRCTIHRARRPADEPGQKMWRNELNTFIAQFGMEGWEERHRELDWIECTFVEPNANKQGEE
ncbi:MAG: hypothetical protein ACRENP_21335 [Longimicrobiales bacterium]